MLSEEQKLCSQYTCPCGSISVPRVHYITWDDAYTCAPRRTFYTPRFRPVTYRLALPPSMSSVHKVFRVSMLRRYTPDPAHVVDWGEIDVDTDGTFEEGPVCIMDSRDQVLRRKTVRLVRVLWQHQGVEGSTWEHEDTRWATHPFLFRDEGTWSSRLILK